MADVKTSLDDLEKQQKADPVAALLEKAGVDSVDELVARATQYPELRKQANHYSAEYRKISKQIKERKQEADFNELGIGEDTDPVLRTLAAKLSSMADGMAKLQATLTSEDGDNDLGPYLRQAEVENPELMGIEDDTARDKALRTVARAMRDSEVAKGGLDEARREGHDRATLAARTRFTGGGPGAGKTSEITDEDALKMFRKDMRGKSPKEQDKITARYKAKFPHLF